MGDWRRVKIEGMCGRSDIPTLRQALDMESNFDNFHCLMNTGGICGLPNWASENIQAVGNLAERDYDETSVAEALESLVDLCPTLDVKIHVGGANESDECVATVLCTDMGCEVQQPEIENIPGLDESQMQANMLGAIFGR